MLTVVIGPPAGGKSTWVRQNAKPGDIVIDFDVLAHALTHRNDGSHAHTAQTKAIAKAARQAAIDKALTLTEQVDVYLIHSTPSDRLLDQYRQHGATIITVDPGEQVVMERAKAERPWQMQQVVKKWYRDDTKPGKTGKVSPRKRGLGTTHEHQRTRLLANHVDGAHCWWCDKPMYRERTRNWDYNPESPDRASGSLAADHSRARANGGTRADRLLHGICNKQRGDGSRDHLRPALTNDPPDTPLTTRDWLS